MVASMSHGEIAEQAAAKRLNADLWALGQSAYAEVLERITPELTDAATRAEVSARGSGVRLVIAQLGQAEGRGDTVTPVPSATAPAGRH